MVDAKLKNLLEAGEYHIYAFHPSLKEKIKSLLSQVPKNCLFYPNEFCKPDSLDEADLSDEKLKDFIFREALPRGYLQGQSPILGSL